MDQLTAEEARVLGCLIEKERTTPEYYPLSINALVGACNQKTNRHPVVEYDELITQRTLHSLDTKGFIGLARASGGRTTKYLHRAADVYEVDEEQLAVIAVLLLRGPQTPGELRSRTERYFPVEQELDTIESLLDDLMTRSEPLVERLARQPGQKEHRYRTLVTAGSDDEDSVPTSPPSDSLTARVDKLEMQLGVLAASLGIALDELAGDSLESEHD